MRVAEPASAPTRACRLITDRLNKSRAGRGWASATWDDRSPELPIGHPCSVVESGRINGLGRGRQGELAHAVVNRIGPAGDADWRLLRPRRGTDCANRAGGLRPATPQLGVSMHNDKEKNLVRTPSGRGQTNRVLVLDCVGVASPRRTGGRVMHAPAPLSIGQPGCRIRLAQGVTQSDAWLV